MALTLQSIALEELRKNWTPESYDSINKEIYELLWDDLCKKFNIDIECIYFKLFKSFIEKKYIPKNIAMYNIENENTMRLFGLNIDERKRLHKLCDNIGIHHQSKKNKKNKKQLYVYLPILWKFEFTEKNPYS